MRKHANMPIPVANVTNNGRGRSCSDVVQPNIHGRYDQMPNYGNLFHQRFNHPSVLCSQGCITRGTIALAGQAGPARLQHAPNHRDLRRQTTRALRRDQNVYLNTIAEETKRAVEGVKTRKNLSGPEIC